MNVPMAASVIKRAGEAGVRASRRRLLAVALAAGAALPACAVYRAAPAPYVARPGSVERGSLRGPFDGRVLDGASSRPLAGAVVLGSWAFESASSAGGPTGAASAIDETDADGRYHIPELAEELRGRLARFTLVIYKKGYVAYRSDRRYPDLGARGDFAQSGNEVKLDRFPSGGSHAQHLRYVGAGGPLQGWLTAELQQASDDARLADEEKKAGEGGGAASATASASPAGGGTVLDVGQLLSPDELKAVTRYAGSFEVEKLGDLPTSAQYDSAHFRATDHPERFDAAVRLFRAASAAEAEKQYEGLLHEYPGVAEKNEVGDRSLRASEGDIVAVAALDRARGAVLVFTCGLGQCGDADTAAALVKRMWSRLDKALKGRPAPAGEAEPAPATPGADDENRFKLKLPGQRP